MNNNTIERIEIKKRGDNVYDVYVNKNHIGVAGCYLKALDVVRDYIEADKLLERLGFNLYKEMEKKILRG